MTHVTVPPGALRGAVPGQRAGGRRSERRGCGGERAGQPLQGLGEETWRDTTVKVHNCSATDGANHSRTLSDC